MRKIGENEALDAWTDGAHELTRHKQMADYRGSFFKLMVQLVMMNQNSASMAEDDVILRARLLTEKTFAEMAERGWQIEVDWGGEPTRREA